MTSALAMVHSRYSTNTFPSWDRAHPYRFIAHNGEINTLRGNINWMHARETLFKSPLFGDDLKKILPVINPDGSDSAIFDNALEMLVAAGRSLPHAILMMIPEPWEDNDLMDQEKKDFYEYHSCLMEPWDGPASMAFTDGKMIGAILDRNGLRPSRYVVTKDDLVIMASEVGVLEMNPRMCSCKGRLQPGKMFLVDIKQGRIISDDEIKNELKHKQPYGAWLKKHLIRFEDLPEPPSYSEPDHKTLLKRQKAFGYTIEDVKYILSPMAGKGEEGVGSMGEDSPLAVLSEKPKLLYNYFKQLFAQVTNPAIDSIREEAVMSTDSMLGPEGNLFDETPEQGHMLLLCLIWSSATRTWPKFFIVKEGRLQVPPRFRCSFKNPRALTGSLTAIQHLCQEASKAIRKGATILVLSDRGVDEENVPIPALLATSAVHHHLIREGTRTKVGLALKPARRASCITLRF